MFYSPPTHTRSCTFPALTILILYTLNKLEGSPISVNLKVCKDKVERCSGTTTIQSRKEGVLRLEAEHGTRCSGSGLMKIIQQEKELQLGTVLCTVLMKIFQQEKELQNISTGKRTPKYFNRKKNFNWELFCVQYRADENISTGKRTLTGNCSVYSTGLMKYFNRKKNFNWEFKRKKNFNWELFCVQ